MRLLLLLLLVSLGCGRARLVDDPIPDAGGDALADQGGDME